AATSRPEAKSPLWTPNPSKDQTLAGSLHTSGERTKGEEAELSKRQSWPTSDSTLKEQRFSAQYKREAMLKIVQQVAGKDIPIIATTGYTGRELYALEDRPNQFYMVGSMGCASSFALGVALSHPNLPVIVLDGDGAVLMRMGALSVIGTEEPRNLIHIVLDNGAYESTGNQATVSPRIDMCKVAEACGYPIVQEVDTPEKLKEVLYGVLGQGGQLEGVTSIRSAEGENFDVANPAGFSRAASLSQAAGLSQPEGLSRTTEFSWAPGLSWTEGPCFFRVPILSGAPENLPRPTITPPEVAKRFSSFLHKVSKDRVG
ncbi:MAG: thiamine pyrophosphate-dependent enzyme, partial [Spirochaetales bacterium]